MSAAMFETAKCRFEDEDEIYKAIREVDWLKHSDKKTRDDIKFIFRLHIQILSWIKNRNKRFPKYEEEDDTQYNRCQVCQSNVYENRFVITDDDGDEREPTVWLHNEGLREKIDTLGNLDIVCYACLSCRELVRDDNIGVTHQHISINSANVENEDDEDWERMVVCVTQHAQKQYFVTHLGIYNRICLIESSLDDDDGLKRFSEPELEPNTYYVDGFDDFGDTPYYIEKKFVHQYFTMRQLKNEAETDFVNVFNPAYVLK
jgi:hypothetical protein